MKLTVEINRRDSLDDVTLGLRELAKRINLDFANNDTRRICATQYTLSGADGTPIGTAKWSDT